LRKNSGKLLFLILIYSFCQISVFAEENNLVLMTAGVPQKEKIYPYPVDKVWQAALEIVKDANILMPPYNKTEDSLDSLIIDENSGIIIYNITIGLQTWPSFDSHIFLIRPLGENKSKLYYHRRTCHKGLSGAAPPVGERNCCVYKWELSGTHKAGNSKNVLEEIEKKIRANSNAQ